MDALIARASISQGNQLTWCCLSLAGKNPPTCITPSRRTYKMDPMPPLEEAPSVVIIKMSLGEGMTIALISLRDFWAAEKCDESSSVQLTMLEESWPAVAVSRGESRWEYCGIQALRCLKAPHHDRSALTVCGRGDFRSGVILCGEACILPEDQTQPNMVVVTGQTTVLVAERRRLFFRNLCKMCSQLRRSSSIEFPPV